MKIACLSGKGGAGKTLVAVNLAVAASHIAYVDCDVEEPNGRLFFKPQDLQQHIVTTRLPYFEEEKCSGCRKCVDFCRFHALLYVREKPLLFPEVCHSCGGCMLVCPQKAIKEKENPIGLIEEGRYKDIHVITGILNPGEASGVPVIQEALRYAEGDAIIDCPPGSACSVMESITDADFCVLVAEPTAFGFHNFKMVYELVTLLKKKCGVVINKELLPYEPLESFCKEKNIRILARIPFDEETARLASNGEIAAEHKESVRTIFMELLEKIGGAI